MGKRRSYRPGGRNGEHSSASWSGDVYLDEPYLSITWDHGHNCVYAEFKTFATSLEFRDGTMKIIDAIRDKHDASLVSDNRRLEGVSDSDQLWIRDSWVPLAQAAGLARIAVVLAPTGIGKFVSQEMLAQMGEKAFATRTFESLPEALKWVAGYEH